MNTFWQEGNTAEGGRMRGINYDIAARRLQPKYPSCDTSINLRKENRAQPVWFYCGWEYRNAGIQMGIQEYRNIP